MLWCQMLIDVMAELFADVPAMNLGVRDLKCLSAMKAHFTHVLQRRVLLFEQA